VVSRIGSLEEDKIKPTLSTLGLTYTRVNDTNIEMVREALKSYVIPKDWNKTSFVVVIGIGPNEDQQEKE
jgi:hypothetical protein